MSTDFTGIENVGEFFSQHYLTEILEKELAGQASDVAQTAADVQKALVALGRDLQRLASEARMHTSPKALYEHARPFQIRVAEALGFAYQSGAFAVISGARAVPALHVVERHDEPYLVVLEGRFRSEDEALLDAPWLPLPPAVVHTEGLSATAREDTLGDVISGAFELEKPPRWVLLIAGAEVLLAERARWGRGQYLLFDLGELLGRKNAGALRITAALLARASLVPEGGALLHDRLDESSHKHAQGVSADLKYAAREAVELLANEWVRHQRTVAKKTLYGERVARELTEECLVYLYRLLVLFYVEARAGELALLPMNSPEYALGYSLEALRDLEQVNLGPETRDGTFFNDSLRMLFKLVNEGYEGARQQMLRAPGEHEALLERGFAITGLHSPLFDETATPRLAKVPFRNEVLQKVIRLLSLTPEGRRGRSGRAWGRGRISYAQLGINQLGAVYEGLLSYTGFFARETLYEVHKSGDDANDVTQQAWFVPERDIVRYREEELLFATDERLPNGELKRAHRKYEPGTFIYRLAGRDRESSASYYTPEVLTRCLVKYALKELLPGKTATEILDLHICEPAMGSGAFLVEAVDQLADAYLERRQAELSQRVPPGEYALEKQKVKSFLAEQRCYGVDLNPMAARLASVSLWLATMHQHQATPWFGARLFVGNSLIGARLAVFLPEDFESDEPFAKALDFILKKTDPANIEAALEPVLAKWEELVPDAVKALRHEITAGLEADSEDASDGNTNGPPNDDDAEEAAAAARAKAFTQVLKRARDDLKLPRWQRAPPRPLSVEEVVTGQRPSGAIYHFLLPHPRMSPFESDKSLKDFAPERLERLKGWRKSILASLAPAELTRLRRISATIDERMRAAVDERLNTIERSRGGASVWGWDQPAPTGGWLGIAEREAILRSARDDSGAYAQLRRAMDLWAALWSWPLQSVGLIPDRSAWQSAVESALGLVPSLVVESQLHLDGANSADNEESDEIAKDLWGVVKATCAALRPLAWELEMPEVFLRAPGFDLIVGNPPWVRFQWKDQSLLEEFEPRLALDAVSGADVARRRRSIVSSPSRVNEYINGACEVQGSQAYLGAASNFPVLKGIKTNLYKCFLVRAWEMMAGVTAVIHQDGIFDDPRGGALRAEAFVRLRWVFRFKNELRLFADVHNRTAFALTVSGGRRRPEFALMANLYHPRTVDESTAHDGGGAVPGIKTDDGQFDTRGHHSRVLWIVEPDLALFARLFSKANTPAHQAALPLVHSVEALEVLRRLAKHPRNLGSLREAVHGTHMWDETKAQKDGTLRRETRFARRLSEWIVSGPHFFVATPLNKTPRENCGHGKDYDHLDLEAIPDDYLPRTNYVPACDPATYLARTPKFGTTAVTDFYRHVHRQMVQPTNERSFVPAIIPPQAGHILSVVSLAFEVPNELAAASGFWSSLLIDYLVRAKGGAHVNKGDAALLPLPVHQCFRQDLASRALRLNCLTAHYANLWNQTWPSAQGSGWSVPDHRLSPWPEPGAGWGRRCAVRNSFERRWALIEVDALAALDLQLSIDELCTVYRTQFSVLREYERDTWFDARGKIAFTISKGLVGVGLDRKSFELWQDHLRRGAPLPKDFDKRSLTPPFERRDREEDMRHAYAFFSEKVAKNGGA